MIDEGILIMTKVKSDMLRLILYFDIFKHPTHKEELLIIFGQDQLETVNAIFDEHSIHHLYVHNFFISSHSNIEALIALKKHKVNNAMTFWNKAEPYFKTIKKSPFVSAACVSGSLSKNNVDEKSDVDYFIIAAPNRVYTAKFFLILYKKIILFNSRKYFCVNYIIDETNLEIPDKNIFTATEIAYLVPLNNEKLFTQFLEKNNWYKNYYPKKHYNVLHLKEILHKPIWTFIIEMLLRSKLGDRFENYCRQLFLKHSNKKQLHLKQNEADVNIRTEQHAAKYHPLGYQWIVKKKFKAIVQELNQKNNGTIPSQFSLKQ